MRNTLAALLLLTVPAPLRSVEIPKDLETMLCRFETPAEWAACEASKEAEVVPTNFCREGKQALYLHVEPYSQGSDPYPGVTLDVARSGNIDWRSYEYVLIDVYNAGNRTATPSVIAIDGRGRKKFQPFSATIVEWTTFAYAINHGALDTAAMRGLQIYFSKPNVAAKIMIDNIRLVNKLPTRLHGLGKQFAFFRRSESGLLQEFALCASRGEKLLEAAQAYQSWRAALGGISRSVLRRDQNALMGSAAASEAPFTLAVAESMTRIFPAGKPIEARIQGKALVELAKGESESIQLVVLAPEKSGLHALRVRVKPGGALRAGGASALPRVDVCPVGFVKTTRPRYPVEEVGWHADPLLAYLDEVEVRPDECQPFWVRVTAPADAQAGDYEYELQVASAGVVKTIPLAVKIWNFSIPKTGHFPTFTSLYQMPQFIHGEGEMESLRRFLLERYRFSFGNLYSGGGYGPAPNPQTPSNPGDLTGLLDLGLVNFNIVYLRLKRQILHEPGMAGEKSKKAWEEIPETEKNEYPIAEKQRIKAILDRWVPELKRMGVYERAYCYGFDEAVRSEWPAIIDFLKFLSPFYPDLKICTTAVDPSLGTESGLDFIKGFIVPFEAFDESAARSARGRGKDIIPYNAKLCIDTPLIQQRDILGFQAWRMGFGGYCLWNMNRWYHLKEALSGGPYLADESIARDFEDHNGWAMLLYPGPPGHPWLGSIRLENWRDGLEDFEYLWLLRELGARPGAGADGSAKRIAAFFQRVDALVEHRVDRFARDPEAIRDLRREAARLILVATGRH